MSTDLLAETGRCVACGLCLPVCPTYRKTQSEADSPRGRIMMTQAVLQGALEPNERYQHHIDLCLTCLACERACPNHVDYGKIIDEARVLTRKYTALDFKPRLLLNLAPHPLLMSMLGSLLGLARKTGLSSLFPSLPPVSPQLRFADIYATENPVGEVLLFTGCTGKPFDSLTIAASIFALNRFGFTVHLPDNQTCCGGLHYQAGLNQDVAVLNERNYQAFNHRSDLPIITLASGCEMRIEDQFPYRTHDVMSFIHTNADWSRVKLTPLTGKVAVHEPCSLKSVAKACSAQISVLEKIPDIDLSPLPGNDQCCGGAGAYMLTQSEMSQRLVVDKVAACKQLSPDYLVSANIGCAMRLSTHLKNAQLGIAVLHPVTLLAKQLGFIGKPL